MDLGVAEPVETAGTAKLSERPRDREYFLFITFLLLRLVLVDCHMTRV
jgi:hypothetical protein